MSTAELHGRVLKLAFEAMWEARASKAEDYNELVEDFVDDVIAELCYVEPDPVSVWAWPIITIVAAVVGTIVGYYIAGGKLP